MNRSEFGKLILVGVLASAGMFSAATPSLDPAVRFGLAVLLVCVLPGYAATAILFHGRPVDVAERTALSLGLSLGIAVLGGLVLNLTPRGLTAATWAVLLGGSTIVMSTIALWARLREGLQRPRPQVAWRRQGATHVMPILLLVASLAIMVGAVTFAQAGVRDQPRDPFTELWLVPGPGPGQGEAVLGIRNFQGTDLRGRVEVTLGGAVVAEFADIDLGDGETWERTVRITSPTTPDPLVASLYREETPDVVFRLVRLWPS